MTIDFEVISAKIVKIFLKMWCSGGIMFDKHLLLIAVLPYMAIVIVSNVVERYSTQHTFQATAAFPHRLLAYWCETNDTCHSDFGKGLNIL